MNKMSKAELKQFVLENGSRLRLSVGSDEMMSQNERAKAQEQNYRTQILKRVNAEDKDVLFASIKKDKGKNMTGGVYGKNNSIAYMSPDQRSTAGSSGFGTAVHDPKNQKYQFS